MYFEKKLYVFLSAVLCLTASANAASISGEMPVSGNEAEYYTPGIINPAEGTVELTALPTRPGSEFQNGWFFAFSLTPGQIIKGNNLLALYTASGENGMCGFSAVARIGDKTYSVINKNQDFLKPGVPVNLALSWGKAGLLIYVDGKLYAKGPYPKDGLLSPMSAFFKIGTDSPFNIQAAKISTIQLTQDKLAPDPAKGFVQTPDTSFMLRKDKRAEYFSTNYTGKSFCALMPAWRLTAAMSPADEKAAITLAGINLSSVPVTYKVTIDAKDFEGAEAGSISQNIILPATNKFAEQQMPLPVKKNGFYKLNITIASPDGRTAVWKSTYMIYPANEKNVKDGKFAGYIGHNMLENPVVMNKLGISWGRAWNEGADYFLWYNIEPRKGVFDWTYADKAVANAAKHGVNILGVFGYPPLWAAENPQYKTIPHGQAYMSGRWKPRSVEEWSNYIYQTVSRYKGQVKYWEIYNEVDFHPPGMPASFSGSTQDYFELLKTAWNAAKKADPECKVLISGFSTGAVCDLNMPYDLLKMGAAKYIDIFSIHSYQGVLGVDKLRQAIDAVAPGMPFWQTEQMWHEATPARQPELTAAIHFWFIEKKFERYFNFGVNFFTSRYTNSPEPVLLTLAAVQNHLRKCDSFIGTMPDAKIKDFDVKHSFKRTDGNYFTAIGKSDTKSDLQLSGDIISAEDIFGRELQITRSGAISILPQSSIVYIVSKTPLKIADAKYIAKGLVGNPGFEDIYGDAMGGLKGLIVNDWKLNAQGGEIILDTNAHSGRYALKLASSSGPKGALASIETRDLAPGKYLISAWMKSGKDKPASASFAMLDINSKRYVSKKIPGVTPDKYTKYSAEFELKSRPEGIVKFYIGAEPDNSILCDDVDLIKLP